MLKKTKWIYLVIHVLNYNIKKTKNVGKRWDLSSFSDNSIIYKRIKGNTTELQNKELAYEMIKLENQ